MTAEAICPGCTHPIDGPVCLLESFELFGAVMCDPCFDARCEAALSDPVDAPATPPTDDGSPDEWAAIIPY